MMDLTNLDYGQIVAKNCENIVYTEMHFKRLDDQTKREFVNKLIKKVQNEELFYDKYNLYERYKDYMREQDKVWLLGKLIEESE